MEAPIFYDYQNAHVAEVRPNTVHVSNTSLYNYFRRYLLQKAISVFKWKIPENWNMDYLLYVLYCRGFLAVVETDRFGVIPQMCGLTGYNIYYQPTQAMITNPLLSGILTPKIYHMPGDGGQCVIFKLQADYGGIMDKVNYYADLMALAAESASVNMLNSKLSFVFTAGSKSVAESFKKLYDRYASGEPMVVVDNKLQKADGSPAWDAFQQNVGQNYIVGDILNDIKKIENSFATDLGIPNSNTDKKERLISDEVHSNDVETAVTCDRWLERLRKSCVDVKTLFGVDVSVDWRYNPVTEGGVNLEGETVDTGTVQLG